MNTDPLPIGDIEVVDSRDAIAVVALKPHPEDTTQLMLSVRSTLDPEELVWAMRFAADAIERNKAASGAGTAPQEPEA